jgi:lipopolysaccharide/colanic/teichoic acid biosynthesis glycosyltransferase
VRGYSPQTTGVAILAIAAITDEVNMQQFTIPQSTIAHGYAHETPAIPNIGSDSLFYYRCKRCLDFLMTVIAALTLLPFIVLIGILIKVDSRGPILFIQERVGSRWVLRNGRIVWEIRKFPIYKFRSMFHQADQSLHEAHIKAFVHGELAASDSEGVKLTNDPRITRIGHLLRRTSLDEIPQLLNVFRGEMSLVGPRPVPVYEVAEYQPSHYQRLAALPGLTGLWQVSGRGEVSFEEMIEMDVAYVRNKSLWLDLKLLTMTVFVVLSGRGAK